MLVWSDQISRYVKLQFYLVAARVDVMLCPLTAHKYAVRSTAMTHSYFLDHDTKILNTTCARRQDETWRRLESGRMEWSLLINDMVGRPILKRPKSGGWRNYWCPTVGDSPR